MVEFEDGLLLKSSCITKDEMKGCQLTRTEKKIVTNLFKPLSFLVDMKNNHQPKQFYGHFAHRY